MIDQKLIIDNPKLIAEKLAKKGCVVDFAPFLAMVEKRKELLLKVENAKAERTVVTSTPHVVQNVTIIVFKKYLANGAAAQASL